MWKSDLCLLSFRESVEAYPDIRKITPAMNALQNSVSALLAKKTLKKGGRRGFAPAYEKEKFLYVKKVFAFV